ncbi:MAG: SH3 domain-containing protein [Lachnospiraceae bacterium]|nr:SH3 domain-containing protein [Lachnospiraceae bacterium]
MKRCLLIILLLGTVLYTCACGADTNNIVDNDAVTESESLKNSVGSVNVTTLRIREEPSEDATVIGLLKKEQKVNILAEYNGFYRISWQEEEDTAEGYVKKEYIDVD